MLVLGIKPRSSARAAAALNHWAISLAQIRFLFLWQNTWQKHLREGWVSFGSQFEGTIHDGWTGKPWQQELEVGGHMACTCTVRKQRRMNPRCSPHSLLCIQLRTAAHGMVLSTVLVMVLPTVLEALWETHSEFCFVLFCFPLDRSKSRKCEKTLTWSLTLQRNWRKRET